MGDGGAELPRWGRRSRWWFTRVLSPAYGAVFLVAMAAWLVGWDLRAAVLEAGLYAPLIIVSRVHLAALVLAGLGWLAAELATGYREE